MSEHPDEKILGLLFERSLDLDESDALMLHLSECEECLGRVEERWGGIVGLVDDADIPTAGGQEWARIEGGLFRQVHLATLGSDVSWLVTGGFLSVVLYLLKPVVRRPRLESRGGSE